LIATNDRIKVAALRLQAIAMTFVVFALAAALSPLSPAHAAPKLSAGDRAWIDACTSRLVSVEKKSARSARIYCTCMHEMVENNEEMSQSDLEHSWPPVHLSCHKKAGWDRESH
jgi:hypothetical protein